MKIFNSILLGASVLALAACSGHEDLTPPQKGMRIHVCAPADGRAVTEVPGYTFKCAMQLYADDGVAVGARQSIPAADGSAEFLLQDGDLKGGATKAVFWAEYVPVDATKSPKVYNSDNLTNISYATAAFNLNDPAMASISDAFCGVLTSLKDGATVTLKRPFVRFNFQPENASEARGAKVLTVKYDTPSSYNILTGTCDTTKYRAVTYSDEAFDVAKTPWFSTMILAPENMSKLNKDISVKIGGRADQTFVIPAGSIPLDANKVVNAKCKITGVPTQDVEISVEIDDNFVNDPDRNVEMKVGSYINSRGKATLDVNSAVGIVFYMGAISGDRITSYPEKFAGKTIKAYAVGISNIAPARLQFNAEKIPAGFAPNESLTNGTQNEQTILAGLGDSPFVQAWYAWTTANAMESTANTTAWYLPSRNQMEEFMALLMETTNLRNEVIPGSPFGSMEFRALIPLNTIFDRNPFQNCAYATCSVNSGGNIQGTSLTATEGGTNGTVKFSQIDVKTKTQSVLARPMITIFE